MRLPKAAELVEAKAHETLTYFAFPSNHWRQVRGARHRQHAADAAQKKVLLRRLLEIRSDHRPKSAKNY